MDLGVQLPSTQSIVAKNAQVQNIAGGYHDHSTTTNVKYVQVTQSGRNEMEDLLKHVAHGALHDSSERGADAPKCHPKTRIAVQKDIMSWIEHGLHKETPKRILWLSGPAGSGGTAIVGTIADECYKKGWLAASFFFSAFAGSRNRRIKKPVIATLIYRLIQHKSIVGLKEEVLSVIGDDPGVFERHLDQQLEELVLKPLRKVSGLSNHCDWPTVIIIDGLDECQDDSESSASDAQKEILAAFSCACGDPAFPFRIIVASRPEPAIRHSFLKSPDTVLEIFLDNKYDPDSDIRLFLEAMLSDIRHRFNIELAWASKAVVDLLVNEASGQFIYAATVIRFLDSPRLGPPQQQLTRILEWRRLDSLNPFAPLDALYTRILHTSPVPTLSATWIAAAHTHMIYFRGAAWYLRCLLESYIGETEYVLGDLASLVRLADEHGNPEFHFYHKSLFDFLGNPHRCSDLHVHVALPFLQERYHQALQARGPPSRSSVTNPWAGAQSKSFTQQPFTNWYDLMDPHLRYTSRDVEWWLSNVSEGRGREEIPGVFASMHKHCKWYRCLPACSVWRKGLLRYCRDHGWRVPTTKEMLQDRFKKFNLDDFTVHSPGDFPLHWRPP